MTKAFLGIGSNLGDRFANLTMAIEAFDPYVSAVSPVYETDPVGGPEQDDFLNAVLLIDSPHGAKELLGIAQEVEHRAGRMRDVPNGPRTLDVDILLVEGETSDTFELTVPHPRMWDRRFVLAPLRDLSPDLVSQHQVEQAVGEVRLVPHVTLR